jgi:hypothetical protein
MNHALQMNAVEWYMHAPKVPKFMTEEYVSVPSALWIVNEQGHVFTLATDEPPQPDLAARGEYTFMVMWSPQHGVVKHTGTWASRIERRSGKVRAFTREGWRTWTGTQFA